MEPLPWVCPWTPQRLPCRHNNRITMTTSTHTKQNRDMDHFTGTEHVCMMKKKKKKKSNQFGSVSALTGSPLASPLCLVDMSRSPSPPRDLAAALDRIELLAVQQWGGRGDWKRSKQLTLRVGGYGYAKWHVVSTMQAPYCHKNNSGGMHATDSA